MFKRLKIRTKILIAFSTVAIVAVAVIAFFAFTTGSNALEDESFNKLTAIREMKASQIEDYFQLIEDQVVTLSEDRMIIEAMRAFDDSLHGFEDGVNISGSDLQSMNFELEQYYQEEFLPRLARNRDEDVSLQEFWPEDFKSRFLQHLYLSGNPFEVGTKHFLEDAGDGSSFSQAHDEYHPIIRDYLERFGYYDIFLVDVGTGGHIAYSVFKEVDFGTSLVDGPYADSNIGKAYRAALNTNDKDAAFLVDYDPYAPSYSEPAAFISSPIYDGDQKIGVLIFQLPIHRIDTIMTNNQDWSSVGLGESGETYLIGDDFTLRNQSRFLIEDSENYFKLIEEIGIPVATIDKIRNLNTTIGLQEVKTEGTKAALGGETGTSAFPDYRGVPVLSSFKPLEIEDLSWVIMSEIDEAEAFSPIRSLGLRLGIGSIALIAFIIIGATLFSRTITKPIEELQYQALDISAGNLDTRISVDTEDEINDLAVALETMRLSNKDLIGDLEDINQNLENLVADRTAKLEASEQRLTFALEGSNDGLWDWNPQTDALYFSPRWQTMLGYESGELNPVIRTWEKLIHPEDLDRVNGIMAEHLEGKSPTYEAEYRLQSKRGEWVWILARGKIATYDEDGKPTRFVGTHVDISERKRLEADIANQLSFIRTLVDTIPNPIFAMGPDQRYILFNKAHEEAYGVGDETLIGSTVMDIESLSSEEKEHYYAQNSELLETGGMNHDETEIRFVDGEIHSILQWVTSFERSDGTIGGLVGISADITDQKELERQLAVANERMSTELNFARDIQLSMLPLIFPAFPTRKEVTIHAALESAREVGGDFYDFYFLDDDHLCFVIGDVAGKGAPGALMMAVSKTLIKSRAADDSEPASILTHVNDELSRDNKSSMFVTVFLGIINVKTGEFVYTNAGHNPPYIKRNDGSIQKVDAFHGPVIGAMPGMPYQQDKDVLAGGEVILLYTDGVTEMFNEEEELYSEGRLETLLTSKDLRSAEGVIEDTVGDVRRFQGEAEQSDDITLLAVQFLGQMDKSEAQKIELRIKNRYEDMDLVAEQFAEYADDNNLPDSLRQSISIVLDELLNNVISYAYQGEKEKDIEIDIELSGKRLVVTLKDSGTPFNPFAEDSPDVSESIEQREIGGLGIHLVRNMMDEYSYQRQINKNVVTLVKLVEDSS